MRTLLLVFATLLWPGIAPASAQPIRIVAAESFYGEAAAAIGGERVTVNSVITGPVGDPHDFEPPPSVSRAVADAAVVIMNGANYDTWMEDLLAASPRSGRVVIDVGVLIGYRDRDNPHIWYHPEAMSAAAYALAEALIGVDPDGASQYLRGRDAYLATLSPIADRVRDLRAAYAGTPVLATEPVYGPMTDALGLEMLNQEFQSAIMNEAEPAASQVAATLEDIRSSRARVLFYNTQLQDLFTNYVVAAAEEAGVPIVGVTETLPAGMTFASWMLGQLDATAKALGAPSG
jgi:zinc/manganese transport system substrate-binding protein